MQNLVILRTWSIFRIPKISRIQFIQNSQLSQPCHLRTRGIFRTLSNTYNGAFCSELYAIPTYSEPEDIRNPVKHLWCSIFWESCIILAYLESWYQNLRNIQNPVIYDVTFFYSTMTYTMKYFIQNPRQI